ncbi:MAG: DNA polymerase III subunit gamma/tau [Anaerolineae bacterium]|nr:DNA polymerase III subunit gamma/tau [Anaerolineae bacterium]
MAQALYRRWRPQTFASVVGQEHVVRTLRNALQTEHIHHAYLLAGPRGTGKTTTARLIAKAVNCLAPLEQRPCDQCEICQAITAGRLMDLVEIDAASNTGVDNIRDLLEKVGFRPTQARYKVYVVDEVHMLSTAAFNALLKTLEEPPAHVIFVLATTEVHKIPETILSRCQRFEFRRIPLAQLVQQLQTIADAEGITVEPEALDLLARAATGSMRDAISLFDQMAAGGDVTADYVRLMLGAERREVVQTLLQAWVEGDLAQGIQVINQAIDAGADPRQLARQIADFLRGLLLMRLGAGETWADPTTEERPRLEALARQTQPERLVEAVRLFSQVAATGRAGWQPQLPLELAFVQATLQPAPATEAKAAVAPTVTTAAQAAPSPAPVAAHSAPTAASPVPRYAAQSEPSGSRPRRRVKPADEVADERAQASASADLSAAVPAPAIETIRERWRQVVGQIQPVSLGALLRGAQIAGVDDQGRLVLAFQHAFHRDKANQEATHRKLEDELTRLYGQRILVRCALESEWQPGAATPAAAKPASTKPASKPPAKAQPTTPSQQTDSRRASPQRANPVQHVNAPPPVTPPPPEEPPPETEDELVRRAREELGAVPRMDE